jgi:isopentenyl phosphate kinase
MKTHLVFLKLGGSLITVKDRPSTPRLEVMQRLAQEIAQALAEDPGLRLLLGHGSGSFGHTAASRYHTRQGVRTLDEWQGFSEVWQQAAELNHLVINALERAHTAPIVFPPSARVITQDGKVVIWDLDPLCSALDQGLLAVVYGDVTFDRARGGTVLSTEDLFSYLAPRLKPERLLFAGIENGVYGDYPHNLQLLDEITSESFGEIEKGLKGSAATDVTGGMLEKVRQVITLVREIPGLQGMIFSGDTPGNVLKALQGKTLGTILHSRS